MATANVLFFKLLGAQEQSILFNKIVFKHHLLHHAINVYNRNYSFCSACFYINDNVTHLKQIVAEIESYIIPSVWIGCEYTWFVFM